MSFDVANTNSLSRDVHLDDLGTVSPSSDQTNCPASRRTVANAPGSSSAVPAGAPSTPGTMPNVVTMDSAAPDGCQGVIFTIGVTLTGAQT